MSAFIASYFPFTTDEVAAAHVLLGEEMEVAEAMAAELAQAWSAEDGWFGYPQDWPLLKALEAVSHDAKLRVERMRARHGGP